MSHTDWSKFYTAQRAGQPAANNEDQSQARSQFQRDFDRIVFSSPFRRLQNKTQVFALPGSVFVHNRLTHSLEVASVGRSLGNIIAHKLFASGEAGSCELIHETGAIVAAACLAHDMGNPPFGHSGEKAISKYFLNEGQTWLRGLTEQQQKDFTDFEGNANAIRVLTHRYKGKREGGYALTYSTLASIMKYPCPSTHGGKKEKGCHDKKYGFFQSEKDTYLQVCEATGMTAYQEDCYYRHPLVYLVEAADDICYQVIDLEDAHRLGIVGMEEAFGMLRAFFDNKEWKNIESVLNDIGDDNEKIAYLRARVINLLIFSCVEVFWENRHNISLGVFGTSLTDQLHGERKTAFKAIEKFAIEHIYDHRSVVEIEIAGYKILGGLLEEFVPAVMENGNSKPEAHYLGKLRKMIPAQFETESEDPYTRLMSVVDFVSGMTDLYALDMYRKLKGISAGQAQS